MKTIFATLVLFAFCFVASAGNDGTVSVLNTAADTQAQATPTPATTTTTVAAATTTTATVACCEGATTVATVACCEEARAVKLAPWTVRRLNRVADRQEAREARKCGCCKESCNCGQDCCKAPTALVESRRKCNRCR
jgi:hypothetical protein